MERKFERRMGEKGSVRREDGGMKGKEGLVGDLIGDRQVSNYVLQVTAALAQAASMVGGEQSHHWLDGPSSGS